MTLMRRWNTIVPFPCLVLQPPLRRLLLLQRLLQVLLLLLLLQMDPIESMMASPIPFEETQPDGTPILLRLVGDEFDHHEVDLDGKIHTKS
jgi:hypothetical protein